MTLPAEQAPLLYHMFKPNFETLFKELLVLTIVISSYVLSKVAGINKINYISVRQYILRTAVIGKFTVHTVHPAGKASAVKLVQITYTFNISGII